MSTVAGRCRMASAAPAGLATASAYEALDSLGSAYPVSGINPNRGSLLVQSVIYATASGSPQIRVHFFSRPPSAQPPGDLLVVDWPHHLGYVDHTTWVSGTPALMLSQVTPVNLAIEDRMKDGGVWVALQALNASWALGGSATPLIHKIGAMQD